MEARIRIITLMVAQAAARQQYIESEYARVQSMRQNGASSGEELSRYRIAATIAAYDTKILQALLSAAYKDWQ